MKELKAVEGRTDPNFFIIARTMLSPQKVLKAYQRSKEYINAELITFLEAITSLQDYKELKEAIQNQFCKHY